MDGTSDWMIPRSWHSDASKIEGNLPKPSSASKKKNTATADDNLQAAPEPEPPNLRCPICLNTFRRPVATLCMHIFCDECIYDVLRHGSLSCPLCRATITEPPEPDTILDRYLEQMIADGAVAAPSGGRSSPYTWRDVSFPQQ
ncbi:hypothetical protein B0H16DRAFT_524349 [Mycena metata]|uniref:RING-type domain-containing protein n=1 Tax=Mycena metata TaxID=1033252 RepID=A0AAD7MFG1_9AGAR|nr:hypothetical protein B0H16DRAFT_524349 [Mycena metata]